MNKILQEPDWHFVSFWKLKSFSYLLPFVFICSTTRHSFSVNLPLAVPLVVTGYLSLSIDVPLLSFYQRSFKIIKNLTYMQKLF